MSPKRFTAGIFSPSWWIPMADDRGHHPHHQLDMLCPIANGLCWERSRQKCLEHKRKRVSILQSQRSMVAFLGNRRFRRTTGRSFTIRGSHLVDRASSPTTCIGYKRGERTNTLDDQRHAACALCANVARHIGEA